MTEQKPNSAPAYDLSTGQIVLLLGLFYVVFALFYMLIVHWSVPEGFRDGLNWRTVYLDYPLKALFIFPIWYLVFRRLANQRLLWRILLIIAFLPLWVKGWQQTYYFLVEKYFANDHLQGSGQWWDIYIPSLFYCSQFGAFFAYEYHQRMWQSERARAESERLVLASELANLKAQLNPHFLYNAFNTISASVPEEQETTRELIAELSNMFRYQLKASREDFVRLGEELDFVQDYLRLEKARFGQRLQVAMMLEDELRSALIPPMILQPLVENAVKHGIAPLVEGGRVEISVKKVQKQLYISVSDNGAGIKEAAMLKSQGFGLVNTRRRLELLYKAPLHIRQQPRGGTQIEFQIPLRYVTKSSIDRR